MEKDVDKFLDVTTLKHGDIVKYICSEGREFKIETGKVNGDNNYKDGVEVHGEDWKQYVSKFLILQVLRDGNVIFADPKYAELLL